MSDKESKGAPETPEAKSATSENAVAEAVRRAVAETEQKSEQALADAERKNATLQKEVEELKRDLLKEKKTARRFEDKAGQATELARKVQALEGELEKAKSATKKAEAQTTALERQANHLRSLLQQSKLGTISGLPKNAVQLIESATVSSIGGERLDAKLGDVLAVGAEDEISALQQQFGAKCRVHSVSQETIKEVKRSGLAG
jgi:predicted RNase H-like nuclease (RuvC/YqgF family)